MSTIHQLLATAAERVGAIGKGGKMEQGPAKYAYRKVDDVIQAVHPVFAELGIVMAPQVNDVRMSTYQTKNGSEWRHAALTVDFMFYGPDGDSVRVSTVGEATDSGDKCANKAHTAALKVALCQLLLIPFDSQDPDDTPSSDSAPSAPRRASGDQDSRSPQKAPATQQTAAERVCAKCDKPIEQGQPLTKKGGKFQHVECETEQAATDAVQETFPGAELVDANGNPVTDEPF